MEAAEAEAATEALSPDQLLRLAETHLQLGKFVLCRQYALEMLQSGIDGLLDVGDQRYASQIIAVAEIMSAASETLGPTNWYSVLQVDTFCDDLTLIRTQFKNLLLRLNPMKDKSQFATDALNLVWKAWNVLSSPGKKSEFDSELNRELAQKRRSENNDNAAGIGENSASFWTFCPYCYYVYEYAKVYEGCCLRCQNGNCRRSFHGLSISSLNFPSPGNGNYVCCFGYFPVGYSSSENQEGAVRFDSWSPIVGMFPVSGVGTNAKNGVGGSGGKEDFIEISDESDHSESPGDDKSEAAKRDDFNSGGVAGGVSQQGSVPKRMNRKMMARSTKKLMCTGRKYRMNVDSNVNNAAMGVDHDGDSQDENKGVDQDQGSGGQSGKGTEISGEDVDDIMEFFEQDGEIYLGLSPDDLDGF